MIGPMARAFGMKFLAFAWVMLCMAYLPEVLAPPCAALGAALVLVFLVQAACNPESQFLLPVVFRGPPAAKAPLLALTFDDGPDPEVTPRVLELLRAHSAKATFFVLGERAEKYPDLIQRIHDEGHDIGTHTYSHHWLFHFGTRAFVHREIQRGLDALTSILGKTPAFFRTPAGVRSPLSTRVLYSYLGLTSFTWTKRARDSLKTTAEQILQRVMPSVVPGAIIAMHDGRGLMGGHDREPTLAALGTILRACEERGIRCASLSEMMGIPAYGAVLYARSETGMPLDRERYPAKYELPGLIYVPYRVFKAASTGATFAGFWVGAVILAWLVMPIVRRMRGTPEEKLRRNHRLLRSCFQGFHRIMRKFQLVDSRATAPLPARDPHDPQSAKGRILVANHTTLVDMTAIVASYPNVVCVAKSGYVTNLWMGSLLRSCGFISAGAGAEGHQTMLDESEKRLAEGFDVLVFPEGTRSIPGTLHPFRRGAFEVACRAKVDVVLLRLTSTPSALTKGLPFWMHPDLIVAHRITPEQVVSPASFGYKSRTMCRAVELIYYDKLGINQSP